MRLPSTGLFSHNINYYNQKSFSFGVSERKNQKSEEVVGYSLPVCLWSKESQPNSEEAMFFNKMNDLSQIHSKLTELFGIENFSGAKGAGKVFIIIIIYYLIINK